MITKLNNQSMENNSILEILKMNDDKRLQGECHIYINCKGTWIPSMKGCVILE